MNTDTRTYVVIVAGGQGTRMGTAIPKQFLELEGKPVLYHTIKAFADALPGAQIILVLPKDQISYAQMILQSFPERTDITILPGGATRFHSVQNGLRAIQDDGIVLVHDGVRPMISRELIVRCYEQAKEKGAVIPAIAVTDSMRMIREDASVPVDRSLMRIIQTPQCFRTSVLLPAFQQEYRDSFTDEATVVEAFGGSVSLTEGDRGNIKITTPEDLVIAGALMRYRSGTE